MKLVLAGSEDREQLNQFYKSFHWSGPVEMKIDRSRDFFRPYDYLSDQYATYLLKDERGAIEGLCSFLIQDAFIENKVVRIAIAKDLRISNHRKAILTWGQHAVPVMEEVRRNFEVDHFFSILNMNEAQTLNAFLRPREQKRTFPRYYLHNKFNLVSLHGRWPVGRPKPEGLHLRKSNEKQWDALAYYITQKSRAKSISMNWSAQQFEQQFERFAGLQKEDFIIAVDSKDNIVGCALPWSSGGVQDLIPMTYNLRAHNFRQFLKFGKTFGWTRTLTKPYSRLKMEAPLNFRYLLYLYADNADIFENILQACYDESSQNEFLVYQQTKTDLHLRRPWNWISSKFEFGLYAMMGPQEKPPLFLHPKNEKNAELNPFMVI